MTACSEMAKKLPHEKQVCLLNCLEASLAICGMCSLSAYLEIDPPEDAVVTVCGHVFWNQCISGNLTEEVQDCASRTSSSESSVEASRSENLPGKANENLDWSGCSNTWVKETCWNNVCWCQRQSRERIQYHSRCYCYDNVSESCKPWTEHGRCFFAAGSERYSRRLNFGSLAKEENYGFICIWRG
ncbi:unnamed protein product [Fraxinus pennsylvanica]|uniref:RING-type domain-containing protein n=1 Tax=Fraxinus pennsylvanica TaxID=56036 RepID=A0AAD2DKG6_9LAMI|nr:unnamed protein product [Fraxinus pennsylvanica]